MYLAVNHVMCHRRSFGNDRYCECGRVSVFEWNSSLVALVVVAVIRCIDYST